LLRRAPLSRHLATPRGVRLSNSTSKQMPDDVTLHVAQCNAGSMRSIAKHTDSIICAAQRSSCCQPRTLVIQHGVVCTFFLSAAANKQGARRGGDKEECKLAANSLLSMFEVMYETRKSRSSSGERIPSKMAVSNHV
jgi:hypothetical protein